MIYLEQLNKLSALKPFLDDEHIIRIILDESNHPFLELGDLTIFKSSSLDLAIGKMALVVDYEYELIGVLNKCKNKLSIITFNNKKIILKTENPEFFVLNQLIK